LCTTVIYLETPKKMGENLEGREKELKGGGGVEDGGKKLVFCSEEHESFRFIYRIYISGKK